MKAKKKKDEEDIENLNIDLVKKNPYHGDRIVVAERKCVLISLYQLI